MSDSEQKIFWLPKYEDIPESEHSVMLKTALEVGALLREQLNEAAERL